MDPGRLGDVVDKVHDLPTAVILTDLQTYEVVAANERAASLFGVPLDELIGDNVISRIQADEQERARAAYAAMATRSIDGYQVKRSVIRPDGQRMALHVWGKRIEVAGRLLGLWFLLPEREFAAGSPSWATAPELVLAVTDHDWQIEYMSADASLLEAQGAEMRGFPLLGLVHPSVAEEFMGAAGRVADGHMGITVRTRMRLGNGGWAERYCFVTRMCEHQPPRLGVVISAAPTFRDGHGENRLDAEVEHCAMEARASQIIETLPALSSLPAGDELSARQTEIVCRLIAGESVPDIARAMFLSPSTVRNHLSAIYRKFGVHSQSELLASIVRAQTARRK